MGPAPYLRKGYRSPAGKIGIFSISGLRGKLDFVDFEVCGELPLRQKSGTSLRVMLDCHLWKYHAEGALMRD